MRLHRFFIETPLQGKTHFTVLDENIIHQWKNVFRLKAGDGVILLDNSGYEFHAEIEMLSKAKTELKIIEHKLVEKAPQKVVTLFAALIKKDSFEWILEKCTELGVESFVPIISERSEKKDLNIERARKIVKEASEQCGRGTLPKVSEPVPLAALLATHDMPLIAFHASGERLSQSEIPREFGMFIGPEGGWTDAELELFKTNSIKILSLGGLTLRAETAAVVASALVLLG